ncbi:hypothetical protein SCATT_06630 [Streptantibioticus cattleyicolor NRRL 8057 = DSM 46488]|uniref:Uncharacterized protein n=1 Tax=Streptantibioticus cattleyicolor (strain ATCC 35852 / DSM 46488 / JCM 4925 / NBRC 14057 / NRRL 8057) TaxID=1003195 RepID=G8WTF1_STREN|nr:hypothetical protein SCATT_06630 [Streptantibioticus cattleyicolor NRRL 8057 = DSM 46488]
MSAWRTVRAGRCASSGFGPQAPLFTEVGRSVNNGGERSALDGQPPGSYH